MRTVTRSLKLINTQLREDPEANRLFMEILTSNGAEIVLRRMNEAGVLGHFIRAFGKIVSMMQFNMYHHYTVDEHLLRCVGYLQDIERGGNDEIVKCGYGCHLSFSTQQSAVSNQPQGVESASEPFGP